MGIICRGYIGFREYVGTLQLGMKGGCIGRMERVMEKPWSTKWKLRLYR